MVGLTSTTTCGSPTNCATTTYSGTLYTGDPWASFAAAAALLILGFLGALLSFGLLVGALMGLTGITAKVSGAAIAAWTLVCTFIGCVVGGAKVRRSPTGGCFTRTTSAAGKQLRAHASHWRPDARACR